MAVQTPTSYHLGDDGQITFYQNGVAVMKLDWRPPQLAALARDAYTAASRRCAIQFQAHHAPIKLDRQEIPPNQE